MRLTRTDLPKSIADAYEAKLEEFRAASATAASPSAVSALVSENDGLVLTLSFLLAWFDTAAVVCLYFAWIIFGIFAFLSLFLAAAGLNIAFIRWFKQREQRRRYQPALLRAVLPLLLLQTKTEHAYSRAVFQLTDQANLLGEASARSLLAQLKTLMIGSEEIARQQADIQAAMSGQSRAEIGAMRDTLALRLAEAGDSHARETFAHALSLCEARLQRAVALGPLMERLASQQELIQQTLSSVGESLAALALAPQAVTSPTLEMVQDSVTRIQRQTQAVEQAVQEVMAVRAF